MTPEKAFNKLSQSVNLKYYVGAGVAAIIRDACKFATDSLTDKTDDPVKKAAPVSGKGSAGIKKAEK